MRTKPTDCVLSKLLAELVDAREGRCFANCARAFLYFREKLPADAEYVEGFWMVGGQSEPHAWIETEEAIIDPTLKVRDSTYPFNGRSDAVLRSSWSEVIQHYEGKEIEAGVRLNPISDERADPDEVARVSREFDPGGP